MFCNKPFDNCLKVLYSGTAMFITWMTYYTRYDDQYPPEQGNNTPTSITHTPLKTRTSITACVRPRRLDFLVLRSHSNVCVQVEEYCTLCRHHCTT